jgi:hypothetical protein
MQVNTSRRRAPILRLRCSGPDPAERHLSPDQSRFRTRGTAENAAGAATPLSDLILLNSALPKS